MSRPTEDCAIVDAGLKAFARNSGPRLVCDEPFAMSVRPTNMAGSPSRPHQPVRLGDQIRLISGHCDPTVNLHNWYLCVRGNRVEQIWPITARGAVY